MTPWLLQLARRAAIGGAALLLTGIVCFAAGARINTSRSIPLGLYWVTSDPVGKGTYVLFCPPQNSAFEEAKARGYIDIGQCPGNFGYMMKRVLAAKGDQVSVAVDGVRVNGHLLAHSAPMKNDGQGRPMPQLKTGNIALTASELLLMSDVSATSFDARYFGTINLSQIKTVIKPVITW